MKFSRTLNAALATVLGGAAISAAQNTIFPANFTSQNVSSIFVLNYHSDDVGGSLQIIGEWKTPVGSSSNTPVAHGPFYLANSTNYLNMTANDIVLISCDSSDYPGLLTADAIFRQAAQVPASAVLLYSPSIGSCALSKSYAGSYSNVYSLENATDVTTLNQTLSKHTTTTQAAIIPQANASTGGDPNAGNPLGPSPTTNVAMIILYSITGLITALFMCIIITGAVRAHRHPERYGLRGGGAGRPRQSRARGLGKAILDSLPIVKFGERDERSKPTDIEMTGGVHGPVEVLAAERDVSTDGATDAPAHPAPVPSAKSPPPQAHEITDVAANPEASASSSSNQGCSICTDDFERGQDQRVLPCDHRFHPACIDPWLLNVSGTCPLCRIDLRPRTASLAGSEDERHDGGDLAPPLEGADGNAPHLRSRRSTLFALIGAGGASRMTREERLVALREHRRRSLHRRASREDGSVGGSDEAGTTVEEESSRRRRLRNAFRIRTRRIGEDEEPREDATAAEVSASSRRAEGSGRS